ncbi:cyanocobalamin reductase / alkylcobalamin dealkylase-like [Uloborus diversus]|uniref:cyanocobalamin reductase / alkylcobalamin dealkylase-like n=1 Tax=Uloborus diversus TaxID=327109 RepID=UPI0024095AF6|nr:cyanocobalamin reductase / alkylcobalamin dealkylase-like [Uloborus diversus]
MIVNPDYIDEILSVLEKELEQYGFEFHPFKVSWYNALVETAFRLPVDEETVAFLVISVPKMFEKAFIPFLKKNRDNLSDLQDPIDQCMKHYMGLVPKLFDKHKVDIVHDFELHPNRKPKIVMQCAAHAAGAAHLYHPSQMAMLATRDDKLFP